MQKWTTRLEKHSSRNRVSTLQFLSSFTPSSPSTEPHSSDEIIKDVFNWLFDLSTPFLVMWIHDKTVTQTILVAQVIAGILAKLDKLSASFFSGLEGVVNDSYVIPTIAYQLAQSRSEVRAYVGQAVPHDSSIFNLEIETQLRKLLCDPLLAASESGIMKMEGIPNVFLIHGLENYNEDHFQSPFLQDFVDVLHLVRASNIPHRLLVIGRHSSSLQSCTSKPNMRQTILERPIMASFWFGKEEETQRREEDLKRQEEGLRQKEEELQKIGARLDTKKEKLAEELKSKDEDIERRRYALQLDEEKLKTQEDTLEEELSRREDEVSRREDEVSRREDEVSRREDEMSRREDEMSKQGDEMRQKDREARQRQVGDGDFKPLIHVDSGARTIRHEKELESAQLIRPQLIYQTPMSLNTQEELDVERALEDKLAIDRLLKSRELEYGQVNIAFKPKEEYPSEREETLRGSRPRDMNQPVVPSSFFLSDFAQALKDQLFKDQFGFGQSKVAEKIGLQKNDLVVLWVFS